MEKSKGRCLICCQNPQVKILKTNEDGGITSINQSLVEEQIQAIFILLNIFELPKNHIEKYLEFVSSHLHPSTDRWVYLCEQCCEIVRKAKDCYEELVRISKTFQSLKSAILDKVKETNRKADDYYNANPKKRKCEKGTVASCLQIFRKMVFEETREFVVRKNNYIPSQTLVYSEDLWLENHLKQLHGDVQNNNNNNRPSFNDHKVLKTPKLNLTISEPTASTSSPESTSLPNDANNDLPLISMSPIRVRPGSTISLATSETLPLSDSELDELRETSAISIPTETESAKGNVDQKSAENLYDCKMENCGRVFHREEMLRKHLILQHGLNLCKTGEHVPIQRKRKRNNGTLNPYPFNFLPAIPEKKRKRGRPRKIDGERNVKVLKLSKNGKRLGRPRKSIPVVASVGMAMPTLTPIKTDEKLLENVDVPGVLDRRRRPYSKMPILDEEVKKIKSKWKHPRTYTKSDRRKLRREMKRHKKDLRVKDLIDPKPAAATPVAIQAIPKDDTIQDKDHNREGNVECDKEKSAVTPVKIKRKRGRPPTKHLAIPKIKVVETGTKRKRGRPPKRQNLVTPKATTEDAEVKLSNTPTPENESPIPPPPLFPKFGNGDTEEVSITIVYKCHLCGIKTDNQNSLEGHYLQAHKIVTSLKSKS